MQFLSASILISISMCSLTYRSYKRSYKRRRSHRSSMPSWRVGMVPCWRLCSRPSGRLWIGRRRRYTPPLPQYLMLVSMAHSLCTDWFQIVNLEEQLEQFREELQNKSEEVQQLHMQLEIQRKELSTQQQELQRHASLQTVRGDLISASSFYSQNL